MKQTFLVTVLISLFLFSVSCTEDRYVEVDRAIEAKLKEFSLPEKIGPGISLIGIKRDKNAVIYTIEFDELVHNISNLRKHFTYDVLKEAVSVDAETNYLMSFFKKKNMDYKWKMVGNISHDSFEVIIKSGEY